MYTLKASGQSKKHDSIFAFGPLSIPTFGLMVATGLLAAAYILQADFQRRGANVDAFLIIGIAGLAGIAGARLYHVLEPEVRSEFSNIPHPFSQPVWVRVVWRIDRRFLALAALARRKRFPFSNFSIPARPRLRRLRDRPNRLSAFRDGDYGIPTSLRGNEFSNGVVRRRIACTDAALRIFRVDVDCAHFVEAGSSAIRKGEPTRGRIFCFYLLLTGVARFWWN